MARNLFSRLTPSDNDQLPWYERVEADDDRDEDAEQDRRHRHDLDLDEENLAHEFHDEELDQAEGLGLGQSAVSTRSPVAASRNPSRRLPEDNSQDPEARWLIPDDDGDNDVPASLLVEGPPSTQPKKNPRRTGPHPSRQPPVAGPSNPRIQAQWETAQARQPLHAGDEEQGFLPGQRQARPPPQRRAPGFGASPRDKAMFRWANVSNLDVFIRDVYDYYLGAGVWCILLERFLHLLKVLFLATLLTLLTQCLDYSKIRDSKHLSQIMIPHCTTNMWGLWNLSLWLCSFYFVWKTIQWVLDIPRLLHIRDFYIYLLEIPDEDMQTVSWQDVVSKITTLRDENVKTATNITATQRRFLSKQLGHQVANQSKERLDAHDIANRLMRRENYIIALFNKDVLNLTAPIPFLRNRQLFSKSLEWTVQFGVLDLIFNEGGQVHQRVLRSDHRGQLSREMKTRFAFAAVMNLIFAPFVACGLLVDFVFTYYNEFKTNTSSIGARQYTPLARWKFREFNELPHIFEERLNLSYPFAKVYIDQFPKRKTEAAARTVQFFASALIAVLALVGFSDPEMFVDFEIFPGMTTFGLIAILTTGWAVARGQISEENEVFDPEYALEKVIGLLHYQPDQWKGRLHSFDVKTEFSELYKPQILIFLEEILGVLITPLVLFFTLPHCSDQIVDFFREFTIHVDGLGYVCSFAVFDFQKDPRSTKQGQQDAQFDAREDYYNTKHGKMQASMYGFLDNYVYNPRSGLPGAHGGGPPGRHLHQHSGFPGLMSPTLGGDMKASRMGHNERAGSRAPGGTQNQGRVAKPGPPVAPSPMASMLLDPHHQPAAAAFMAARTPQRARQPARVPPYEDRDIIEESTEDTTGRRPGLYQQASTYIDDAGEVEASVARLGESTWEESPRRVLSREESSVVAERDNTRPGMVTLLKQFQDAHLNQRGVM